jgi:hypothetical protein
MIETVKTKSTEENDILPFELWSFDIIETVNNKSVEENDRLPLD